MEVLGALYRRRFRRKSKRFGEPEGALCKSPSESSVNSLATGLISRVLRFTSRRGEPASRPHSWHSTKLGEGQLDPSMMQISQDSGGVPWHPTYHSSASNTDLSSCELGLLRKSPDQYSSRGSMESLDHGHPAYSSCHQLSVSKSSNSIDHLHNKRDSAYSSFSTSSSIPESPAAGPSFCKERSYSMDSMIPQRGPEGMRQADIRYVRTVYDPQQGISEEHEVSSARLLRNSEGRGGVNVGAAHHGASNNGGASSSGSGRFGVGPGWGQTHSRNSCESPKGAPAPPLRSDSYAAIRNHERPNSWSSLEQARSIRALQKASWHSSSGSVTSGKSAFTAEGQLHTVVEKSPESSPTTKPKQNLPQASQPGRFMLPTGIYPVPQPEPHFAQVPTCCPNSSSMYPALAKESRCSSHMDLGGHIERSTLENGCQTNSSSSSGQHPNLPHTKPLEHQKDRRVEDSQTTCGHYRPHFNPGAEPFAVSQSQAVSSMDQGRRDPYTPVKPRGERQRPSQSFENTETHAQVVEDLIRPAAWCNQPETPNLQNKTVFNDGPVGFECTKTSCVRQKDVAFSAPNENGGVVAHAQGNHTRGGHTSAKRHSDSDALQQQEEHPLTRLENALVQVQSSGSQEGPSSLHSSESGNSEADTARLSVLEKVIRFEQREMATSRNQNVCSSHSYSSHSSVRLNQTPSAKSSLSGMEDICSRLERSDVSDTKVWNHRRTQSHNAGMMGPEDYEPQQRYPTAHQVSGFREPPHPKSIQGKPLVLQRSKSTFQLAAENCQDCHWKDDLQDILSSIQDSSFNRAYRDSIKDAQSKVLRSTSFRRKDLSANSTDPSKHLSLERKGPKTGPKPCRTSPHTPKERHIVAPEAETTSPPALPSVPPVGPPVARIGGRKRLTLEQKKRSYSEPENMHEVGLSDSEGSTHSQRKGPTQLLFHETSVADRRKLFELAAAKCAGSGPSPSVPRPELKQLQQDALADYMERKTGRRASRKIRPTSAYLQPSSSDSQSLSPASSFASLQEPGFQYAPHHDGLLESSCSSFTRGLSFQGCLCPSGNPTRLQSCSNSPSPVHRPRDIPQEHSGSGRESNTVSSGEPHFDDSSSLSHGGTFCRAAPSRSSGKSASAEDLLDHSEKMRPTPQHVRSRSSPSVEKHNKDLMAGDHRQFATSFKELLSSPLSDAREMKNANPDRPAVSSHKAQRFLLNQGPSQVMRREKQRHSEGQRAHSASALAASVGLPSSFSPPPSSTSLDWWVSERLCRAALDLPLPPPRATRQSSTSTSEEMLKDAPRDRPSSAISAAPKTDRAPRPPEEAQKLFQDVPRGTSHLQSSQMESPSPTPPQPLPTLHISESSFHFGPSPSFSQTDDEVFLDEAAPSSSLPPHLPIRETDITEDLPQPSSPPEERERLEVRQSAGLQLINSFDHSDFNGGTARNDPGLSGPRVTSDLLSSSVMPSQNAKVETQLPISPAGEEPGSTAGETQESAGPEHPVLSRRERSAEELRVEVLAKALISRDKSLTPILDTWAMKSTMDLIEEIFPTKAQRQGKGPQIEERSERNEGSAGGETSPARGNETDLDQEEADLSRKKAELAEALTLSVAALREEKEGLTEEQKRFGVLSSHMEALVQEHCKPSECDKYRMFIGDLDKIVNLLLSLCGRLARVDNALTALGSRDGEDSTNEREALQQKRRLLCGQHEDARELKENLDRRERVVLDILAGYLNRQQLDNYQQLVRMKPALLIRQRCLDELIKQGEEQLQSLGESFPSTNQDQPGGYTPAPRSTAVTSL